MADWMVRLTPKFVSRRVPIIKKTRQRRRNWDSREQFIDHHKTRRAYKVFTEQAFADYAEGGLEATSDGQFTLVFNPAWEAFNFQTTPYIWDALSTVSVPTLLLSAEHTYLHDHAVLLHHAKRFSPSVDYAVLKGLHHLAPQQAPDTVASEIIAWLRSTLAGPGN